MTGQLYSDSLMCTKPFKEMVSPFGIGRINKLIIQELIHEELLIIWKTILAEFLFQKREIMKKYTDFMNTHL